ncbi:hypothetical protein EJ06DRAFT_427679 [Trichodelitschia bisporula]|uniref:Uncharacterized protein n=1 Tax=Trichodelitschia bisporula TaxID=703511 RepID=A0A6G1HWY3_9PEZI|nr:hypothetical protein EJ06DRAFT_427679 [Trichodelitschia bisporula]
MFTTVSFYQQAEKGFSVILHMTALSSTDLLSFPERGLPPSPNPLSHPEGIQAAAYPTTRNQQHSGTMKQLNPCPTPETAVPQPNDPITHRSFLPVAHANSPWRKDAHRELRLPPPQQIICPGPWIQSRGLISYARQLTLKDTVICSACAHCGLNAPAILTSYWTQERHVMRLPYGACDSLTGRYELRPRLLEGQGEIRTGRALG